MSFRDALAAHASDIQAELDTVIAAQPASAVRDGMCYALLGGKRLRGFLVLESAALHGIETTVSMPAAAAIEALHTYSLVHDDLPCMDDDELRRGKPTVHMKWDEATAVLVGDALQTLAYECLAGLGLSPERRIALIGALAKQSGARGMVLGQAQDIAAETAQQLLTLDEITELQANKTGALINWSATAGPLMTGADPEPMRRYGTALGLAFQIADDILDVEGDEATAGKRLKKDAGMGKATFVSLLGIDGAKARARALIEEADSALLAYGSRAELLRDLARFAISRDL